jgi:hypothetical protein
VIGRDHEIGVVELAQVLLELAVVAEPVAGPVAGIGRVGDLLERLAIQH